MEDEMSAKMVALFVSEMQTFLIFTLLHLGNILQICHASLMERDPSEVQKLIGMH
jgi:hypothetical protein